MQLENEQMQQQLSGTVDNLVRCGSETRRSFLESKQRAAAESFVHEKPPRYTAPDPQAQAGRLQKQTDLLRYVPDLLRHSPVNALPSLVSVRCTHCFAPRTGDLYARFCTECGLPWQNLAHTQIRFNQLDGHSVCFRPSRNITAFLSFSLAHVRTANPPFHSIRTCALFVKHRSRLHTNIK